MTNPTAQQAAELAKVGPREIKKFVCAGCPALKTERWTDHLDNDETDSGTLATCTAADKQINVYWHDGDPTPAWCPSLLSQGGSQPDCVQLRKDANWLLNLPYKDDTPRQIASRLYNAAQLIDSAGGSQPVAWGAEIGAENIRPDSPSKFWYEEMIRKHGDDECLIGHATHVDYLLEQMRGIARLLRGLVFQTCDLNRFHVAECAKQLEEAATLASPPNAVTDAAREATDDMLYRGNSLSYYYAKANVYGETLLRAWDAMKEIGNPADGRTDIADAIRKLPIAAAREVEQDARLPREPSYNMLNAAINEIIASDSLNWWARCRILWKAMYDAAMKDKP